VLVFGELFRAFAARSTTRLFWEVGPLTNLSLLAVVVVSVLVQIGIQHMPETRAVFEIEAMPIGDCALSLIVALVPVTVIELGKLARRVSRRNYPQPLGNCR
jgi:P-type Ca2+ transporter type 2C